MSGPARLEGASPISIVELKTRILAGKRVEIPSTGLPEGSEATVRIVVEEPKRKPSEILADYPGGQESAWIAGRRVVPCEGPFYVDTNAVIFHGERSEPYYSITRPTWEALDDRRIDLITSELTLLEVLVKPLREGDATLVSMDRTVLLEAELVSLPINPEVLELAASLRAACLLKPPDSIHAATALRHGCTTSLASDEDFRKVGGLNVAILREFDPVR